MTDDGGYDLKPADPRPAPAGPTVPGSGQGNDDAAPLKPGDPGWTPPVPVIEKPDVAEDPAPPPDPDVEQHKMVAALAYLFFFLPLVAAPRSPFARFHANQGLLLLLAGVAITWAIILVELTRWIVARFMPVDLLRWFFSCGFFLLEIALLIGFVALLIKGVLTALDGEKKELPVIGHWKLIK